MLSIYLMELFHVNMAWKTQLFPLCVLNDRLRAPSCIVSVNYSFHLFFIEMDP